MMTYSMSCRGITMVKLVVTLNAVFGNKVVSKAIDTYIDGRRASFLFSELRTKLIGGSIYYQLIVCLEESIRLACNRLGWKYSYLELSPEFDSESFQNNHEFTKSRLIDSLTMVTGKRVDDKAADIFIDCFEQIIADKQEVLSYIESIMTHYNEEKKVQIGSRIKYKNRIIAFVDILGFKNLVEDSTTNKYEFQKILDSLDRFRELKKEKEDQHYINDVKVTTFSDSLVISYPVDEKDRDIDVFYSILLDLTRLQLDLLDNNVIIRGGIAIGKLRHTQNEIFGPAMNEAYYLESKVAKYPRIVVRERVIMDYLKKYVDNNPNKVKLLKLLRLDEDANVYFLDYLGKKDLFNSTIDYNTMLQTIESIIIHGKKSSDGKTLEKYEWLGEYYKMVMDK